MKNDLLAPPTHLSKEAKARWTEIQEAFSLEDVGLHVLESYCESFDKMREAQAVLKREGITYKDKWGQPKQHPATLVLRDAQNAMLKCIKALNLDVNNSGVMPKVGRPGGKFSG